MTARCGSEVLVIGSANTDLVVRTDHLPGPGETILGGKFFTAPGGKGANQAVAASRAGARVTFVTRVGRDEFGRRALDGYRREGVNTDYVVEDPDLPSGIAFILVDSHGENSIVVASGANSALSPVQLEAAAPAFDRAAVCLLQLESPLPTVVHAVAMAEERGLHVILNPAPARELPPDALGRLDLLTPNESETEILTGIRPDTVDEARRAAESLRNQGVAAVLITLGSRGALLVDGDGTKTIPAPQVEVQDTTAAGDAFNGGVAAALSQGLLLGEAAAFACCAGALSVTREGAQPSLPFRNEILDLMEG